jgi:hypothetical protein
MSPDGMIATSLILIGSALVGYLAQPIFGWLP